MWLTTGGHWISGGWVGQGVGNKWNWANSGSPCESLHGTECDIAPRHMTKLNLGSNGLFTTKLNQVGVTNRVLYEHSTLTETTTMEFKSNEIGGTYPPRHCLT